MRTNGAPKNQKAVTPPFFLSQFGTFTSSPPEGRNLFPKGRKKNKALRRVYDQRRSFVPFVVSTDGLLGFEAKNLLKQIAKRLTAKWEQPHSGVRGFVNARINLAILQATNLCIRGSRVPASKMSKRVQWHDGAGLGLFETV
jgi:hypothetical protein